MYIYICKKHKDEEKWQTELSSQKLEPKFNWTQTELFFISLLTSFYIEMLMHGRDCNSSFCNRLLLANHSLLMLNEGDDCMHYNLNVKSESLSSLWKWYLPGMKCKERWLASQRGAPVNNCLIWILQIFDIWPAFCENSLKSLVEAFFRALLV